MAIETGIYPAALAGSMAILAMVSGGQPLVADETKGLVPQYPQNRVQICSTSHNSEKARIVIGTRDGQLIAVDAETGKIIRTQIFSDGGRTLGDSFVAVGSDGDTVYVTGTSDRLRVVKWKIESGVAVINATRRYPFGSQVPIRTVKPSPDLKRLLIHGRDWTGTIDLTAPGKDREPYVNCLDNGREVPLYNRRCAAWFQDSKRFVTHDANGNSAIIWDSETGKPLSTLKGHTNSINGLDVSGDGTKVVTGSYDKTAAVWDTKTGEQTFLFQNASKEIPSSIKLSSDGTKVAVGYGDRSKITPVVWDTESGKKISGGVHDSAGEPIEVLGFTKDGSVLIAAPTDKWGGFITFISVRTGKIIARWMCVDENKNWLLVSSDGRFDGTDDGRKLLRFNEGDTVLPAGNIRVKQLNTPGLLGVLLNEQKK